jgi:predicted transcriptional regulator
MPRPRVYSDQRVSTAVRLPEALHLRLRQAATDRDVSVNLLVTRAVDDYLTRLAPVADVFAGEAEET